MPASWDPCSRRAFRRALGAALALALWGASPAAAQYFGRNKVQYRAFDFQVIRTAHFDIHFYPEERAAAMDAARLAERGYARLARVLGHELRNRKPILLYASHAAFQQTNALPFQVDEGTGGVTEPIKDRVIVPFTGSYADFEHVLVHELVHAFQFDVLGSVHHAPMTPRMEPPLWFMEGMAEYLSIGRIDAHTAAWVADAVRTGYMRDIAQMNTRDDYLSYRFGQSLWAYIGARWGDETIGKLLRRTASAGVAAAFQETLGLSLSRLSDDWLKAVRQEYLPPLADRERPASVAVRLTDHARLWDPWYLAPALSPDGRQLVYLSQRDGEAFSLWLADARTGKPLRRLVAAERNAGVESLRFLTSSAAFSRDGRFLAFSAQTHGEDALCIYDVAARRIVRRLTFDLDAIAGPSWSPDGRRIVFSGMDGGASDLFVTDLAGQLTRLTHDRYADLLPAWSADGTRIAFSTDRGAAPGLAGLVAGELQVAIYHLATGAIEVLPGQQGKNLNPVWAPDGRSLVWISDRGGTSDLYLFDLEAGRLRRLTGFVSAVTGVTPLSPALAWGADGRLVFVYFERAGYNLYAMADPTRLPALPLPEAPPVLARGTPPRPDTVAAIARGAPPRPDTTTAIARGAPPRPDTTPAIAWADAPLPDTSGFTVRPYSAKLTPDIVAQPGVGAGLGGTSALGMAAGGGMAFSDLLGNRILALGFSVSSALSESRLYAGYSLLRRRPNVGFSLQQAPYYTLIPALTTPGSPEAGQTVAYAREVFRTAVLAMDYPVSQFRRFELSLGALSVARQLISTTFFSSGAPVQQTRQLLRGESYARAGAALVFDNALFGWTGPVAGRRYRVELVRTMGQDAYGELSVDARQYGQPLRPITLGARLTASVRHGGSSSPSPYFWGGPYSLPGYSWGSFDPAGAECRAGATPENQAVSACPARDRLTGSSLVLGGVEARFPLAFALRRLGLGLLPLDGAVFADGGLAWNDRVCVASAALPFSPCPAGQSRPITLALRDRGEDPYFVRTPAYGYGFGIRTNLGFGVLRLDYAIPLSRPRHRGVLSFAIGPLF